MFDSNVNLGALALRRSNGVPSAALADLMTSVISMSGFIHATGVSDKLVLEAFDDMVKTARETLVDIMKEDKNASA